MNEEILKHIYDTIKEMFSHVRKSNWIWVDFFADEASGFEHFKSNIASDEEVRAAIELSDNKEDSLWDIAYEISCKLKRNDFFNVAQQSTRLR